MLFKTLIIEDEYNSLEVLKCLIDRYASQLTCAASVASVSVATQSILEENPHVVFLDVNVEDGRAFELLKKLPEINFELVFVAAIDNYMLEAIKFSEIGYLLKPICIQEFQETVCKVLKNMEYKTQENNVNTLLYNLNSVSIAEKKITIPTLSGYDYVYIKDIVWCGSSGNSTTVYLKDQQKIVSSRSIGYYEEILTTNNFCRINNNIIVNVFNVKRYIKGCGGQVVMVEGTELEISQRRKTDFLNMLRI